MGLLQFWFSHFDAESASDSFRMRKMQIITVKRCKIRSKSWRQPIAVALAVGRNRALLEEARIVVLEFGLILEQGQDFTADSRHHW